MTRLSLRRGRIEETWAHAFRALELAESTSYKRAIVLAREELGDLHADAGKFQEAIREYRQALESAEEIAPEGDLVYECCWRLARALLCVGSADEAERLATQAIGLAEASSDRRELGNALATLALVQHEKGAGEPAAASVRRALAEFQAIQTPFELAEAHGIAATVLQKAAPGLAHGHLLEARRLYGSLGAEKRHDEIERRLGEAGAASAAGAAGSHADHPDEVLSAGIVLADPRMTEVADLCRRLGAVDSTVLIEGETGTGKEVIARLIHDSGDRKPEPFVAVNCAAVPGSLLETELFGHKRGAFTGAVKDRRGVLEVAGAGTVLLDEIDKSSLSFQAKLLRVVEDRKIHPIGSSEYVPLRARVLCAANRDLRTQVKDQLFLEDLYFRLSPFRVTVPPLRDRPQDLETMVEFFLHGARGRLGDRVVTVSAAAMTALRTYPWPGNVRELKNAVERAFFLAQEEGRIDRWHLPPEILDQSAGSVVDMSLGGQIARLERREIERALRRAKGVKADAARILGVSRKGLLDRLRRLGME